MVLSINMATGIDETLRYSLGVYRLEIIGASLGLNLSIIGDHMHAIT